MQVTFRTRAATAPPDKIELPRGTRGYGFWSPTSWSVRAPRDEAAENSCFRTVEPPTTMLFEVLTQFRPLPTLCVTV
jgi:hypothetical protein